MREQYEREVERILLDNYEKYYRLAVSYVRKEQDALDVVQESAYKAVRDCGQLKDKNYISTWIYRIVVNTALDFLRKNKREEAMEDMPEAVWEDRYEEWDFKEILSRLEEKERTVIVLRYLEDLKLDELARIMDENLNTVKARLYRGLKKLRLEMGGEA